jgi:transposase-like protein
MRTIPETCTPVNARELFEASLEQAYDDLRQTISVRLNALLVALADQVVGREPYVRRSEVAQQVWCEGSCCRCGSKRSQRFSRNGFRRREPLLTPYGEIALEVPRVRCECGGSVQIDFGELLQPYQRMGKEVDAQIQRWGHLALSLRQMREELRHLHIAPLALRTLNRRLHLLQDLDPQRATADVPPILQVDAVWVTLLCPNGKVRRDRKGRVRAVKGRHKVPIMIAMGVWPDSERCEILLWRLGKSESAEEWVAFLELLEAQGIRGAQGLRLIIHDGGAGLCAALQTVWFDAAQQRCLFHKLRNIARAIRLPETLTREQRQRQRHQILKDFRLIWAARRYPTMLRRYLDVVRTYRETQPEAVATLRRDFRATVTYYALENEFPDWQRRHLRTTSRLERFNRTLRRRTRSANAYHSEVGLSAMMSQEIRCFHDAQSVP